MAVTIATTSLLAEGTRTGSTYTAPTGIANGDLLILWFFEFNGAGLAGGWDVSPDPPTGFSAIPTGTWPQKPAGGDYANSLWYKIAGGSEPGTYTVSNSGSDITRGLMLRVTGANTSTPFDVTSQNNNTTGTSTTTFTGITTTVNNDLIIALNADDNDAGTYGNTSGGNLTLTLGANTPGESAYSAVLATAGPTGTITAANRSNAGTQWFSALLAVQPAAGGGTLTVNPSETSIGSSELANAPFPSPIRVVN